MMNSAKFTSIAETIAFWNSKKVVLASASPRRKEILELVGLKFKITPSTFPENLSKDSVTPQQYTLQTALRKAQEVSTLSGVDADLVIGCDTIVVLDDKILEKPADAEDAVRMVTSLSGRTHFVYSGVALVFPKAKGTDATHCFVDATKVEFEAMSAADVRAYVASGESLDKAGAYGIQGRASAFVKGISGSYHNVVGFPIQRFCHELLYHTPSSVL